MNIRMYNKFRGLEELAERSFSQIKKREESVGSI